MGIELASKFTHRPRGKTVPFGCPMSNGREAAFERWGILTQRWGDVVKILS